MSKFLIRRLIQSIPTIIGITIIAYTIMDLAPGNPLSQVTLNPELSQEERQQIFEAAGFYDPLPVKYFRWLIGDAPFAFNATPAWSVSMDNGDAVIINTESGDVIDIVPYESLGNDVTDNPLRSSRAGEREIDARGARAIAAEAVPDASVGPVEFLPYWGATVLWAGNSIPIYQNGEQIGEEVGRSRGILRGDMGISFSSNDAVTQVVGSRLGATAELGFISLLVGTLIGIPVGVLAAVYQGSIFDQVTRVAAVLVSAIPVFWLGLILLMIFGSWLQVLPMGNRFPIASNPFSTDASYTAWERISHLILPVFTLSSFTIATFSRFMRASLLNVLSEDYVRTARAKGLSDRKVWFKHSLRNAMIPIATLIGPSLTGILGGAVLTETIYSWPGMGRLVVDSVTQQDYPVIMAVVLLFSLLTIIGYLISDILYAVFDPRIRLS